MPDSMLNIERDTLKQNFSRVRSRTLAMASMLSDGDATAQSMPDASPAKWHLAHTSWFFEEFLVAPVSGDSARFDSAYAFLFNSYYNAIGDRHARDVRGLLTRPSLSKVRDYRAHVDREMLSLIDSGVLDESIIELGIAHEEQHQELFYTDILHLFSQNPLRPTYISKLSPLGEDPGELTWTSFNESITEIGHEGDCFAFDCESPRHRAIVPACEIADRAVTNREWMEFINRGGYDHPEYWLADGFTVLKTEGWQAPLYWYRGPKNAWWTMTLAGPKSVDPSAPVTHISFFEADAYANYCGARLPTEQEWERAAIDCPLFGNDAASEHLVPVAQIGKGLRGVYGDVWEWTTSAFSPYPGFKASPDAVGEYNGKFMNGQRVLRGGSCATPQGHMRATYRNFFHPDKRWQFTGVRLARDAA